MTPGCSCGSCVPMGLSTLGVPSLPSRCPSSPIRGHDGGLRSVWRTVLFWLLTVFAGLSWDGGEGSTEMSWQRSSLQCTGSQFGDNTGCPNIPSHWAEPGDFSGCPASITLCPDPPGSSSGDQTRYPDLQVCPGTPRGVLIFHPARGCSALLQHQTSRVSAPPWPPLLCNPMAWT